MKTYSCRSTAEDRRVLWSIQVDAAAKIDEGEELCCGAGGGARAAAESREEEDDRKEENEEKT